jgi:hypothetical protein
MSEDTPTTAQVRTDYVRAHDAWGQDFDRWLASVKADAYRTGYNKATADIVDEGRSLKAKADAWEEGEAAGHHNERCFIDIDEIVNPYRGEQA